MGQIEHFIHLPVTLDLLMSSGLMSYKPPYCDPYERRKFQDGSKRYHQSMAELNMHEIYHQIVLATIN